MFKILPRRWEKKRALRLKKVEGNNKEENQ